MRSVVGEMSKEINHLKKLKVEYEKIQQKSVAQSAVIDNQQKVRALRIPYSGKILLGFIFVIFVTESPKTENLTHENLDI